MNRRKIQTGGYTRTDLLVCLLLIVVVLPLLTAGTRTGRHRSRTAICMSHLRGWGQATESFVTTNDAIPRGYHYYGWSSIPVNPNTTPPEGATGACIAYYMNDVTEDATNGDWMYYGTPYEMWLDHGLLPEQLCCPGGQWLRFLYESLFGQEPSWWLEPIRLAPQIQKPFGGPNGYWRRWMRMTYMYVGNMDMDGNTFNDSNPRAVNHPPMLTPMDPSPDQRILAGDMVWWDESGAWSDYFGISRFRINHSKTENVLESQNILYGDGHIARTPGEVIGDVTEDMSGKWTYSAVPSGNGPWYFW